MKTVSCSMILLAILATLVFAATTAKVSFLSLCSSRTSVRLTFAAFKRVLSAGLSETILFFVGSWILGLAASWLHPCTPRTLFKLTISWFLGVTGSGKMIAAKL